MRRRENLSYLQEAEASDLVGFGRIWSDLVGFREPSGFALQAPLLSYQELYGMLNHYQLHMWHASCILKCAGATELPQVTGKLHISEKMLRSISG